MNLKSLKFTLCLIIIIVLLLQCLADKGFSQVQFECLMLNDTTQVKSNGIGCDDWLNYAPYPYSDHTPNKKLRIAFHIFQDSNGENNFQNIPNDLSFLNDIIFHVNNRLPNLEELQDSELLV